MAPKSSSLTSPKAAAGTAKASGKPTSGAKAASKAGKLPLVCKKTAKKVKQERPKDLPGRPLSAYNLFFREERIHWLEEKPKGNMGETRKADANPEVAGKPQEKSKLFENMAREVGKRWKELSSDKKQRFIDMAKAESDRYRAEMKQYQQKMVIESKVQMKAKSLNSKLNGLETEKKKILKKKGSAAEASKSVHQSSKGEKSPTKSVKKGKTPLKGVSAAQAEKKPSYMNPSSLAKVNPASLSAAAAAPPSGVAQQQRPLVSEDDLRLEQYMLQQQQQKKLLAESQLWQQVQQRQKEAAYLNNGLPLDLSTLSDAQLQLLSEQGRSVNRGSGGILSSSLAGGMVGGGGGGLMTSDIQSLLLRQQQQQILDQQMQFQNLLNMQQNRAGDVAAYLRATHGGGSIGGGLTPQQQALNPTTPFPDDTQRRPSLISLDEGTAVGNNNLMLLRRLLASQQQQSGYPGLGGFGADF